MKRKEYAGRRLAEALLTAAAFISFIAVFFLLNANAAQDAVSRPVVIDRGWYMIGEDGTRINVDINYPIRLRPGKLVIYNDIISSEYAGKTISTSAAQYGLRIKQGGNILYEYKEGKFKRNSQMKANLFCDAEIPQMSSAGGDAGTAAVSFEYYDIEDGCIKVPEVKAGSSHDIFWSHFRSEGLPLSVAVIFVFIAAVLCGTSFSMRRLGMKDRRLADLALFMLMCSGWEFTNSPLTQQLCSMPDVIYYLSFCMFMLMGVPLCGFIMNTQDMYKHRSVFACMMLFYINFIVQNVIYFVFDVDFSDMLLVTHVLLAAGIIAVTVSMAREARLTGIREIRITLTAFIMLGACGIVSLVLYRCFDSAYAYYNTVFWLGMVLFVMFLLRCVIVSMIQNIQFRSEAMTYKKISGMDLMTGLGNHAAFARELEHIEKNAELYSDVEIIFIGISGMKKINDRYGYKKGDEIIIAVSNSIKRIFGDEGVCYRTFGDEFCVIITDPGPEAGESVWSEQLAFEMSHITRNGLYEVTLYWGSSFIRDENGKMKTVSDWKFEADTKLNEHRQVKISKNK